MVLRERAQTAGSKQINIVLRLVDRSPPPGATTLRSCCPHFTPADSRRLSQIMVRICPVICNYNAPQTGIRLTLILREGETEGKEREGFTEGQRRRGKGRRRWQLRPLRSAAELPVHYPHGQVVLLGGPDGDHCGWPEAGQGVTSLGGGANS